VVVKVKARAGRFDWGVSGHGYMPHSGVFRDMPHALTDEIPRIQHQRVGAVIALRHRGPIMGKALTKHGFSVGW
jgi:hypothetical protein